MKICLINPPNIFVKPEGFEWEENLSTLPYLGIAYLASVLEGKGYDVDVFDCPGQKISAEEMYCITSINKYDILGVSVFYYNFPIANKIIYATKSVHPDTFIITGGYLSTLSYDTVLNVNEMIDCCVIGEGEYVLVDIIRALENNGDWRMLDGIAYRSGKTVIFNKNRHPISNLDALPFPKRSFVENKAGVVSIMTSRGCYGKCSFCSEEEFYIISDIKGIRYRSAVNVVDEIELLIRNYQPRMIRINDSNFCDGSARRKIWLHEFCSLMKDRKLYVHMIAQTRANDVIKNKQEILQLKEIGLDCLFVGIETFIQRQLELYNKKISVKQNIEALQIISELGLNVEIGFMILEPFIILEEVIENLDILKVTGISNFLGSGQDILSTAICYIPIPDTRLYATIKEQGLLSDNQLGYEFKDKRVAHLHLIMKEWAKKLEPVLSKKILLNKATATGDKQSGQILLKWFRELFAYDLFFLEEAAHGVATGSMTSLDYTRFIEIKAGQLKVIEDKYTDVMKKMSLAATI